MPGVDRVKLTMVTDNHVDMLLADLPNVTRTGLAHHFDPKTQCVLGENGIALHVEVSWGRYTYRALFDTGMSANVLLHNLSTLHLAANELDHVVLSHGHPDHYGGLQGLLDAREAPLPISVHPDAFAPRYLRLASGQVAPYFNYGLTKESVTSRGGMLVEHTQPLEIGPGLIATGPIPRETDFEVPPTDLSAPNALLHVREGKVEADVVPDDQALVIQLGDGIIVLAGCSHAGIINTINYAKRITGVERVIGAFGGFHLGFPGSPKAKTEKTIQALKDLDVEVIAPSHCTGMEAIMDIARAIPGRFLLNVTGSAVSLQAGPTLAVDLDAEAREGATRK
ncbi:7,8-dihydropterin-6-yl-methyl-4-(beta-D-ribofuranosyl)aminobenzene 5'-phosphate synthase [Pseudarthrobacter siccitolerans]|uniref:7, 8-dihydropterin-6-yl-methyl-4-(Beta-D-ribofuranosyl)aminobenzene 5'-phosphate synthase n=1 Tax=Pseudarthrobacter siccitolerans TaxID=861266 RepID=A0ABU0PQP1_9MICC|nr:MBL fold metallo-hydrolase [Pseudarthrobacter siccitolerans]MDQ0676027.1 7,8-dihydropterin-6-yl-methyl-4-(beta-D-ribofuranosyl)aminobenzene 5'-phosphate synthase [Pseudarthrobacter siccitolerans]